MNTHQALTQLITTLRFTSTPVQPLDQELVFMINGSTSIGGPDHKQKDAHYLLLFLAEQAQLQVDVVELTA